MSSRGSRSSGGSSSSGRSKSSKSTSKSHKQLIESLETHRVNTLTELCRIESIAASCSDENEARAFQEPMTAAWKYYVSSNQLLSELRGMTRSYPFAGAVLSDASKRVRADPQSNRSWNFAWLVLVKIREDDLITTYAALEAAKPEMWGDREPDETEISQLAECFEYEWISAVSAMLKHWTAPPTWY